MPIFDDTRFLRLADQYQSAFAAGDPFPHVVIDDFLPTDLCDRLLDEFPGRDGTDWLRFDRHHSKKLATKEDSPLGELTRETLADFNAAGCLRFLERLTGITGLIADPYFEGGGLHQIETGGFLKVHVDFNYHRKLKLDRRLNLIVYLNKDWKDEYHGHLELWDRGAKRCVKKVLPVYNRCVVFATTEWSYHGHPDRLTCPPDRTRKSLALYYYTNGRPDHERAAAHGTMWKEKPAASASVRGTCAGLLRHTAALLEGPGRLLRKAASKIGAG
jgi:hypothetical protein